MSENIKSIFDRHGSGIKFNEALIKELKKYGSSFVNSSEETIHFFGGNSIGVYPVRFKPADRYEFLIDLLGLDENEIRTEVKNLPTVNEDWIRGTDVMNLSCLWIAHKFKTSNLSVKDKVAGMYQSILILNFKLITSLMAHFFPHPVSEELSQMIYDQLSLKYTLKKEGSWMGLMIERTNDIINEKGIHSDTLTHFNDDGDIQYMITDVQGRLRSIIKNLWEVLADIRDRDLKRHKQSYFSELEGEMVIRDMSKKYPSYRLYIEQVIDSTPAEFIKPDLVTIVASMIQNLPRPLLGEALIAFHTRYNRVNELQKKSGNKKVSETIDDKNIHKWFDLIITHCFEQVISNNKISKNMSNVPELLVYMKSLYMASKSKGDVETMRNLGERFIKRDVKGNNPSVIASVRTGIMLYIIARMTFKDHYG